MSKVSLAEWNDIHCGYITQAEIRKYIENPNWQTLRESLLGTTLEYKFEKLKEWLEGHSRSREAQVQVTNYINALRRGGLLHDVPSNL